MAYRHQHADETRGAFARPAAGQGLEQAGIVRIVLQPPSGFAVEA